MTFISDIYLWHLYLIFLFDIDIWHLSLTFISNIPIWHLYLTFTFDIYIWYLYLTLNSKVYWFWLPCVKQYTFQKCIDLHMDRQTLCFTVANFRHTWNKHSKSQNSNENTRYWAILAAPVVAIRKKKHVVSLCKFKSVLIYTWIAKPFILPLQIFLQW